MHLGAQLNGRKSTIDCLPKLLTDAARRFNSRSSIREFRRKCALRANTPRLFVQLTHTYTRVSSSDHPRCPWLLTFSLSISGYEFISRPRFAGRKVDKWWTFHRDDAVDSSAGRTNNITGRRLILSRAVSWKARGKVRAQRDATRSHRRKVSRDRREESWLGIV